MARELQRVVITGIGSVSPYGLGKDALWQGLLYEPPRIKRITLFDTKDLPVQIAAEVPNFDGLGFMDAKIARRTPRFTQFAVAAATEALMDSGLNPNQKEGVGVFLGTTGGLFTGIDSIQDFLQRGWHHMDPFFITKAGSHMVAARVGSVLGLRGPSSTVNSACASGLDALGQAFNVLRLGQADVLLAGGADAIIEPLAIAALARIGALTKTHNGDPATASRPFDRGRDGFVIGEGAGVLTLETLSHAQRRGAHIYAEVLGIGGSFDAMDDTAPDVHGQLLAMSRALVDADVNPEQVDGVKAHGTSTVLNDRTETAALKKLLGKRAWQVPVTAPKSKIGHAAAAAGAVETVGGIGMLTQQVMAPTANLTDPDPECDLDYVTEGARSVSLHILLLNAFGLGGQNWSLVLRHWQD